jgi:ketosteroid isomerase-like protein
MHAFKIHLFLFMALGVTALSAQEAEARIRSLRAASNQALKAYDYPKVLSFLTDDVLTTTGAGTLLCGKKDLQAYIEQAPDSKMYWVRTPSVVSVNAAAGLAWETGTWKGYDPAAGEKPVVGGNYSAMWTRASGDWKIKSQLFVSLEEP